MLSLYGNSIDEKAIAVLRLVKDFICSEGGFSNMIITRVSVICEIITFSVSDLFGSPMKVKWKQRKVAFGEREESCFDEREKGERNFANKNKQGHRVYKRMHQLENTIKDANNDLAKVLKENFKREDFVKSHTIIQMTLNCKQVLESILEDLEAKKHKLWVSRSH